MAVDIQIDPRNSRDRSTQISLHYSYDIRPVINDIILFIATYLCVVPIAGVHISLYEYNCVILKLRTKLSLFGNLQVNLTIQGSLNNLVSFIVKAKGVEGAQKKFISIRIISLLPNKRSFSAG